MEKVSKVVKYCPQYHYHTALQQKMKENNLMQYTKMKNTEGRQGVGYYKSIMSKYFEIRGGKARIR